ncbi:hypothetical protein ABT298_30175 [Streptomyces sp. NPDC001034]|uniref:hypothetical protein n=1 Tax=Streptomyces sp. NPDC001034 TaxID=3154375 RepID=UPI00332BFF50
MANQPERTERALEAARDALAAAQHGEPQPDWAVWVDPTELEIMTGRCWTVLRRPLRAVPALTGALRTYSDHNARDKALYMSWLADSYLIADEVEEAARVSGSAGGSIGERSPGERGGQPPGRGRGGVEGGGDGLVPP